MESKRAETLVHIDKLKHFEGDAPECWLTKQTDGTGDVGFSDGSAPVSPITAGSQTLPYMAGSDVENRTETATFLAGGQHLTDYGNAPQRTELTETTPAPVNRRPARTPRRPRRLNDFVRCIYANHDSSCETDGKMTKVMKTTERTYPAEATEGLYLCAL